MDLKIKLSHSEYQDLVSFCNLNDLLISDVVKKSFISGFNIEKYGLLGASDKVIEVVKEVEKPIEVVKEVEVVREVIKEVEKPIEVIKYIDREVIKEIEKPIEVIKYVDREVIKEIPVEKIVNVHDSAEVDRLLDRIKELENESPKTIEIIKEIPIEVIKEVEVEKPIEIIKEVYIERPENNDLKSKLDALQNTLLSLRKENVEKENKIKDYEQKINDMNRANFDRNAVFLRNSNLNDTLFK